MAKRFSELGITPADGRKIFNCQKVSITDILNREIEVREFLPDVKTKHGEGRYIIHFALTDGTGEGKFFTNSQMLKDALGQVKPEDLPFVTVIKSVRCGDNKMYQFT